jgi:serine acetyltransferase
MRLREDLVANRGDPRGAFIVVMFRVAAGARASLPRALALPIILVYKIVVAGVLGVDIPASTEIGPGLKLQHAYAVVVHPSTRIGACCRLNQSVTIGIRGKHGAPVIGDHVSIGSGAQVLGGISLGDRCVVGAGAVVVHDMPSGCVAKGPAATITQRSTGLSEQAAQR